MSMDNKDHVTIAAFQELQQAITSGITRRINLELFDHLCASIRWLIYYCIKKNIPLPDIEKLEALLDKAEQIDEKIPL
jgi:hypothetical protein